MIVTRFADDFVVGFQYLDDARQFLSELREYSSANDQIWNQTYEYETTGYYQYENDNGQCGDLDQMPVRVSQVDGPR